MNVFSFGTAMEGLYTIKITVGCGVVWVNLAYAIVDDFEISDAIDVSETEEEEEDDDDDDAKETIEKVCFIIIFYYFFLIILICYG